MSAAGFFLILGIVILIRLAGNKTVPLVMPTGRRLKILAAGWVGGFLGSLLDSVLWHLGPQVAGVSPLAAIIGCVIFLLLLGLFPFVKIMVGKV